MEADERSETPVTTPTIRRLSPSRIADYEQCPKLFEFKTIQQISTPPTEATTRGSLVHTVLERLFDLAPEHRTEAVALEFVEPAWRAMCHPLVERSSVADGSPEALIRDAEGLWADVEDDGDWRRGAAIRSAAEYLELFPAGSDAERSIVEGAKEAVRTYFLVERPANFEPEGREDHVEAELEDLILHGYLDRLDRYVTAEGEERWVISDYKTSSPPTAKDRSRPYFESRFFAMRVYALLLRETADIVPHSVRLIYVGPDKAGTPPPPAATDGRPPRQATNVARRELSDEDLDETRQRVLSIWAEIKRASAKQEFPPKTGPLCNWCHFKENDEHPCPAFI